MSTNMIKPCSALVRARIRSMWQILYSARRRATQHGCVPVLACTTMLCGINGQTLGLHHAEIASERPAPFRKSN